MYTQGCFIDYTPPPPPSLRGAQRRSNPCRRGHRAGLLRFARNDGDRTSIHNPHRQRADTADEIRVQPLRRADDLKTKAAVQDFLPEDADLLFGEAVADAAVDTGAESEMLARLLAVDDELVGPLDLALVAIAGDVPHHDLVALGDPTAGEFGIAARGAAHMQYRRLVTDDLGNEVRNQLPPRPHQFELIG